MVPGCTNRIVGWIICLDDDPSRRSPSPGPASYLGEQLKGCLPCSEIRPIERKVCRDHPYEGYMGKIVPLGNHLGANENIGSPVKETLQYLVHLALMSHDVSIHLLHPRIREYLSQGVHYPFRAKSIWFQLLPVARRAALGRLNSEATVVAEQDIAELMIGEAKVTVGTPDRVSAEPAQIQGTEPPPVKKQNGLLCFCQVFTDSLS